MASIWHETVQLDPFGPLPGDMETGAVVIGGGLAGLLTAYFLREKGVDTVLLESGRIAGGTTGGTTGKITTQHGICYSTLLRQFGREKAGQYALANTRALERYAGLVADEGIDCDFARISTHLYATESAKPLETELRAAQALGLPAELTTRTELPFPVRASLRFDNQAQFHPLKFIAHLTKKLTIYEHTRALSVEGHTVKTDRGDVEAKYIVVATHFPFINRPGYYFMRLHQERSYVLALEGAGGVENAYLGIDGPGLSLRGWDNLILLGGANHRTGQNKSGGKYDKLTELAKKYWPDAGEACRWSTQDCIPHDGVPYIGKFSSKDDHIYVATGFRKWGMTGSMTAATLLSDAIVNNDDSFGVFSPQRNSFVPSLKGLAIDGYITTTGLASEFFMVPTEKIDHVAPGTGEVIEHRGENVGAYRDQEGVAHLVKSRCPHLGCQLTWNADEGTWDCPCHGSRFTHEGKLLDTPAQTDLEVLNEAAPYQVEQ